MLPATDRTRIGECVRLQDDHPLIAMNVTMLSPMLQSEIGGDGQLKHATIVMVNPTALVRGVFVLTLRAMFMIVMQRLIA